MNRRDKVRLVVVTGGASGIGRATALAFSRLGACVVVSDIDEAGAESTVALITARGGSAHPYWLDVADSRAWEEFGATVKDRHGVPDVVVNNAGIAMFGSFLDHAPEDWERILAINLMGVLHGCRVFGRQMVTRGAGGSIVNIASAAAFNPSRAAPAYCVSKAAVRMASECLRIELAGHGIGVSAICPGLINTNIADSLIFSGQSGGETLQRAARTGIRLGGSPDRVANAVVRAVRHDWAVVPVRFEGWLLFVLSRLSPAASRAIGQYLTSMDLLDYSAGILRRLTLGRNERPQPVPPISIVESTN